MIHSHSCAVRCVGARLLSSPKRTSIFIHNEENGVNEEWKNTHSTDSGGVSE